MPLSEHQPGRVRPKWWAVLVIVLAVAAVIALMMYSFTLPPHVGFIKKAAAEHSIVLPAQAGTTPVAVRRACTQPPCVVPASAGMPLLARFSDAGMTAAGNDARGCA